MNGAGAVSPTLLAVAHGSRDPRAPATVEALLDRVRALRPGLVVRSAYVEITPPSIEEALVAVCGPVVVVPLLLSVGYHVRSDIPSAVAVAARPDISIAPPLGPHPLLAGALVDRLAEVGAGGADAVVLAAAGSSDPRAATGVAAMAALLAERRDASLARAASEVGGPAAGPLAGPVVAGFASATRPTVAEAVAGLRARGAPSVAVATYLLAPGHFDGLVSASGADAVAPPLGTHDAVARLVLERYDNVVCSHIEGCLRMGRPR